MVGKYEVLELNFSSSGNYSNPYIQVSLSANFERNGEVITVPCFWDGGNSWMIRVAFPYDGNWTYVTTSNDSGMNNISGNIEVVNSSEKGFVIRDFNNPYAWKTPNGEHHLWVADTCWRFGQKLTVSQFKELVDVRATQGFTHIRGHFNSMDIGVSNEGGSPFTNNNWDSINPEYWRGLDTRIAYANSKGITMDLTVGSGSRFPSVTTLQRERYLNYLIARYSAYDITWEGLSEYEEYPNGAVSFINSIGNFIKNNDPLHHLISTHTLETNSSLLPSTWLDWIMHASLNWNLITTDMSFGMPIINEEFYYENSGAGATHAHMVDADTVRKGAWTLMTYGATGFAYGNTGTLTSKALDYYGIQYASSKGQEYITYLINFWKNTNYWKHYPDTNVIVSGNAVAVSNSNSEYVLYYINGGQSVLNLSLSPGILSAKWYNPRNGTYSSGFTLQNMSSVPVTTPDTNDWVLYLSSCTKPECDYTII